MMNEKTSSMGLQSGEYGGKQIKQTPYQYTPVIARWERKPYRTRQQSASGFLHRGTLENIQYYLRIAPGGWSDASCRGRYSEMLNDPPQPTIHGVLDSPIVDSTLFNEHEGPGIIKLGISSF